MSKRKKRLGKKIKDDISLGQAAYALIMSDPVLANIYKNFIDNRKSVFQFLLTRQLQDMFYDYWRQIKEQKSVGKPIYLSLSPEASRALELTKQTQESQPVFDPSSRRPVHPDTLHEVAKTLAKLTTKVGDSELVHALYTMFLTEFNGDIHKALEATKDTFAHHYPNKFAESASQATTEPQGGIAKVTEQQVEPPVLKQREKGKAQAATEPEGEQHPLSFLEPAYAVLKSAPKKVFETAKDLYKEIAPRATQVYNVVKDKVIQGNEYVKEHTGGYIDPLHWLHKIESVAMYIPKTTQSLCAKLARTHGKSEEEASRLQRTLYLSDFIGGYGTGFLGGWLGKLVAGGVGGLLGAKAGMFFPSASLLYLIYLGSKKSKKALHKAVDMLLWWKKTKGSNGNERPENG